MVRLIFVIAFIGVVSLAISAAAGTLKAHHPDRAPERTTQMMTCEISTHHLHIASGSVDVWRHDWLVGRLSEMAKRFGGEFSPDGKHSGADPSKPVRARRSPAGRTQIAVSTRHRPCCDFFK